MARASTFLVTYVNEEGEEEVIEVIAFSEAQARFLTDEKDVLSVEQTEVRSSRAGYGSAT